MNKSRRLREQFRPWAGLVIGTLAAAFVHQFGSDSVFDHCAAASPVPVLVIGMLGIAATIAAALVSWRSASGGHGQESRTLIGFISVGSAALFVMAMTLPLIAALVLPRCFQ